MQKIFKSEFENWKKLISIIKTQDMRFIENLSLWFIVMGTGTFVHLLVKKTFSDYKKIHINLFS